MMAGQHSERNQAIQNFALAALGLAFGVTVALGLNAYGALSEDARQADIRAELSAQDREDLATNIDTLREQLIDAGIFPSAPPATPAPKIPEAPEPEVVLVPGPAGPSCVQEFGLERCRGPRGVQGQPGQSCIEAVGIGECRGDEGPPGVAGADSTVPGPVGASCVEELGLETCRGEPGTDGTDGQDGTDGADGIGIVSVTLEAGEIGTESECDLVITYTEGEPDRIAVNPLLCKRIDVTLPE